MGRKSPRHGAAVRGRTQKFLTPAAKSFVAGTSHPGRLKRDVVISAPGKSGGGELGAGAEVAAEEESQRRPALRLTPRLFHRRGAMSAGYGATGRRIRLRMLQAGFYASDRSVSPKPRQRVRRSLAGASAAAPAESGSTTGCRQAVGSRRGERVRDLMTESLHDPVRTSDITAHHPVTGKPGLQRRRRCFPLFRQAPACQGFFARADRRHPCCP
ncbi:hypothetical protein NAK90_005061 [Salmonella enterica]|nr:hypothetical protein [Salmonella enterica]EJD9018986.1 hypothetical protein [Salmonella enterica subsp. enterica serovar Newport]EJG7681485.1 hypothetical protein [Salmonella enterica]HDI1195988.1 hypothetical protein [Salmonella enterica]